MCSAASVLKEREAMNLTVSWKEICQNCKHNIVYLENKTKTSFSKRLQISA